MQTWIGGIESMRTSNREYQNKVSSSKEYMLPSLLQKHASLPELSEAFSKVEPQDKYLPTCYMRFQTRLANYIREDYMQEFFCQYFRLEVACIILGRVKITTCFLGGTAQQSPRIDLAMESWTKRAGNALKVARQLSGTLKERLVAGIEREGMTKCFDGLAVTPVNVTASASKTMDPASLHGGCPPMKDVKYTYDMLHLVYQQLVYMWFNTRISTRYMERVGHEKRF
ncbi:hypothetical protein DD238_000174 [Peronospora effusa]|uniref:Uncharacterized protein n=1 Tax=Peronospora effusa TaxID=542832 RepID=A0A3M6VU52_9STRA|nr:hypothetical protein DD238_000174 [Peronospora effusa]